MRRFALRRRIVAAVAGATAVIALGVTGWSVLGSEPAANRAATPREPEVVLNELPPAKRAPRADADRRREREPVAGRGGAQGSRDDEEPPARILRENAKLRAELEHLRALQREQRRVELALGNLGGGVIAGTGQLIWPLRGAFSSPFGQRWGRLHAGIDIAAPGGTPIRAADSGRVALAGPQGGYGLYTCIQHGRTLSTCYAHQSELGTARGAAVRQGQVIGFVGNTGHSFGDHLHFEVRVNGRPTDPLAYL